MSEPTITRGRAVRVIAVDLVGIVTRIRPGPMGQIFEVAANGRRLECKRHEIAELYAERLAVFGCGFGCVSIEETRCIE